MATLPKPLAGKKETRSSVLRTASVAEAKENLSALLRAVEKDCAEVIVQRRGVAVAKIIPFSETAPVSGFGWMQGTVRELGDIVSPTGEEWDASPE